MDLPRLARGSGRFPLYSMSAYCVQYGCNCCIRLNIMLYFYFSNFISFFPKFCQNIFPDTRFLNPAPFVHGHHFIVVKIYVHLYEC